jgi:hypothetical protein
MTDVAKRKAFDTATPGAFVVVVLISSWFFFGPHPRAATRDAGDFVDMGSIVGRSFVGRFFYSLFCMAAMLAAARGFCYHWQNRLQIDEPSS